MDALCRQLGKSFSAQLKAQGGTGADYKFSLGKAELPKGIELNAEGLFSGKPELGTAGTYAIPVVIADAETTVQAESNLVVLPVPAVATKQLPERDS